MAIEGGDTALSLSIDASQAERGARAFADAVDKIIAAGNRAADAVDRLGAEIGGAAPAMGRAGDAARRTAADIETLGSAAGGLSAPFGAARTVVAGFVAGIGAGIGAQITNWLASLPGEVIEAGDAFRRLDTQLAIATRGMEGANDVQADLFESAQRLGVAYESQAGFFAKLAGQSRELGLSYQDIVSITETLSGALKVAGASADDASRVLMQLGQAFGSGKFAGDEFKTTAESAPQVLDRLSAALGVTRGELLKMASDGDLTTAAVSRAVLTMKDSVEADLRTMGSTVSDEAQRMANAWDKLLAEFARTGGVSDAMAGALREITALLGSEGLRTALEAAATAFSGYFNVIGTGLRVMQAYSDGLAKLSGQIAQTPIPEAERFINAELGGFDKITSSAREQNEAIQQRMRDELGSLIEQHQDDLSAAGSKIPRPAARPTQGIGYKMVELEKPKTGRVSTGEDLLRRLRETELKQQNDFIGLINFRRDEEIKALNKSSQSAQEKARGRVLIEQNASREILAFRRKEADAISDLEEGLLQQRSQASGVSGQERLAMQQRIIELKRDQDIADLQDKPLSNETRQRAVEIISETAAQRMAQITQEEAERTKQALDSIQNSYDEAFGNHVAIIERRKEAEIKALNETAATEEERARARVQLEDVASREITQIRQRETDQVLSYLEQIEAAHIRQFRGDENRLLGIERAQQLRQLEQQQNLSPDQREQARAMILDMTQPLTELERAGVAMVEFGERLTSVEGVAQGVIQGISQIGATASAAFADAIIAGEDFGDTLSKLGESLARMMIQMTLQMAMQQALGLAVGGIGSMFAPQPGAGTTAAQPYPMFTPLAKGGVVETRLEKTIYEKPTYFPMRDPGYKEFAKGVGLLGEAGPEAVLPLTRTSGGELGVKSSGERPVIFNMSVNNMSRASVSTEERDNNTGGKDIMLTIADDVEAITAARASRSGTRLNRSITGIGQLRAR